LVGGAEYVSGLPYAAPSPSGAKQYAKIVKEKAVLCRLIRLGQETAVKAFAPEADADAVLTAAEDAILAIAKERTKQMGDVPEPKKLAEIFATDLEKEITQISTPFTWINDMAGGLLPGNLFTIAGRTSAGKSALALQIAKTVAIGREVCYISLEMPPAELLARYVASETDITHRQLMLHKVPAEQKGTLDECIARYSRSSLYFTSAGRDVSGIERIVKSHKPELLIIDTVNLVKAAGESERVKILNVTRDLKQLALAEDIPIIILAQLSRRVDDKQTPTLSDIKESASIEEDSDVVLLLSEIASASKLEKIAKESRGEPLIDLHAFREVRNEGDRVILALIQKNRNGRLGQTCFRFSGRKFKFAEISEDDMKRQMEMTNEDDLPF
jgi:replicative DNA helicase